MKKISSKLISIALIICFTLMLQNAVYAKTDTGDSVAVGRANLHCAPNGILSITTRETIESRQEWCTIQLPHKDINHYWVTYKVYSCSKCGFLGETIISEFLFSGSCPSPW